MRAIIELAAKGEIFNNLLKAARKVDAGQTRSSDYFLTFESSKLLLSELTASRIGLLEELRASGPMSIYGLAKRVGRNYSNVHSDITRLIEHGLVEKFAETKKVHVPFDSVEIRFTLNAANH